MVLSAPTGSGKSTAVPRWFSGRVLVVEPRRVACRSLAARVAELEGSPLGTRVGYHVRDDRRLGADTSIVFATPGIVLRALDRLADYDLVVLDEFHERGLDTDLLYALLQQRAKRLLVMSATVDGDRIADHLRGAHVQGEGRQFEVEVEYAAGPFLPDRDGLPERVAAAVSACRDRPGDMLVFLPGKGEIHAVASLLEGTAVDVVRLHGGLSLQQQQRAFRRTKRKKVVLTTNVAETSLTIDGVGTVIDSGLVRRTRYHQGRGYLSLSPIAMDSAEQRAGRAGRTGPGYCLRLWGRAGRLEARTPPEIHRESLVPLLLAAGAAGASMRTLRFLDPPKEFAVAAAEEELQALGALSADGALTSTGRELFGLPLDPHLGRLLVEGKARDGLHDMIDAVAGLSVGRPLFVDRADRSEDEPMLEDLCDGVAMVDAVRAHGPVTAADGRVLEEARRVRTRLHRAFDLSPAAPGTPVDRKALALSALRADPRLGYIARQRKRHRAWANGGTEIELGRESRSHGYDKVEALVVLDTRALGLGKRDVRVLATCAMPVPLSWLVEAGLGRDRPRAPRLERGVVTATLERVYAKRVLDTREEVPQGLAAREAIAALVLSGRLYPGLAEENRRRLQALRLASRLDLGVDEPPDDTEFLTRRLDTLGVESGTEVSLLDRDDLLADEVPFEIRGMLESEYPLEVSLGDAHYRVEYDLKKRQVMLHMVRGARKSPPPKEFLPPFKGFRVFVEAGRRLHRVR